MKIKLIIWDLDDTLWQGTLAEGDNVRLHERRAVFVRALNNCGIVSAICSKNDHATAQKTLESFHLWDEFVFPRISFTPKGEVIKKIIEDMHLRPVNALFVDDNVHNLNEVRSVVPDINILDASREDADEILTQILEDNKHVNKRRVEEYRILQTKADDRQCQAISNEDFLRSCDIRVSYAYRMDNLDFANRIEELANRSNQLNYTKSRFELGQVTELLLDIQLHHSFAIFTWDRYGYYGLVGFIAVAQTTGKVIHFVFSCRVMHMGIEQASLAYAEKMLNLYRPFPDLDLSAMAIPLPDMKPDWVTTVEFNEARTLILAKEAPTIETDSVIRIIFNCQSGGIAHFSKYRDILEFDNYPRLFIISMMLDDGFLDQYYPPYLVYGAGADYVHIGWPEDVRPLLEQNLRACALRFCQIFGDNDRKVLVLLMPENMPDNKYSRHEEFGCPRERAIQLNNVWREYAAIFPCITLLDTSDFALPEDMLDVNHFYAGFLQKVAQRADAWYESRQTSCD
jgi:FkbH-like protein